MDNISLEARGRVNTSQSAEDQAAVFYEIVYLPDNQICVDCSKCLQKIWLAKTIYFPIIYIIKEEIVVLI